MLAIGYLLNNLSKGMGIFFCYALKYNLRLVVVSKLGNIDRSYNYKVKLPFGLESFDLEALDRLRAERLLPNFETTWQGALLEGHNKKRYPCPSFMRLRRIKLLSRYVECGN